MIMTAKEKAIELGNKFYQGSVFDYDKQGHLQELERAIKRSKICVQEILDAVTTIADKKFDFYTEVMKEVDSLYDARFPVDLVKSNIRYCVIHDEMFSSDSDDVCPGCIKDDIDEQTIQDEK